MEYEFHPNPQPKENTNLKVLDLIRAAFSNDTELTEMIAEGNDEMLIKERRIEIVRELGFIVENESQLSCIAHPEAKFIRKVKADCPELKFYSCEKGDQHGYHCRICDGYVNVHPKVSISREEKQIVFLCQICSAELAQHSYTFRR